MPTTDYRAISFKDFPALRKAGEDPYTILNTLFLQIEPISDDLIEALRAIGAGSSPWIQLAKYLMRNSAVGCV
jgi:hypothetical protein